jgi:hypothetical protein
VLGCACIAYRRRSVPGMEYGCIATVYSAAGCYVQPGSIDSGGLGVPAVAVQGPAVAAQGVEGPGCTGVCRRVVM